MGLLLLLGWILRIDLDLPSQFSGEERGSDVPGVMEAFTSALKTAEELGRLPLGCSSATCCDLPGRLFNPPKLSFSFVTCRHKIYEHYHSC